MGGWVGPRAGMDAVEQIQSLARIGNRTPAVQPVAILNELSRLLDLGVYVIILKRNLNETEW
jgi:L-lysine 2,3-aminomutase